MRTPSKTTFTQATRKPPPFEVGIEGQRLVFVCVCVDSGGPFPSSWFILGFLLILLVYSGVPSHLAGLFWGSFSSCLFSLGLPSHLAGLVWGLLSHLAGLFWGFLLILLVYSAGSFSSCLFIMGFPSLRPTSSLGKHAQPLLG
jgi:hypothetical protein